jgi:PhnB protein
MRDVQSISPVLTVRDVDASIAFYHEVLGFPESNAVRMPDGKAVHGMARRGSVMVQFSPEGPADASANTRGTGVVLYIRVGDEDIDRYWETVIGAGAKVLEPIDTKFWGDRTFIVADPDGYHLMFAQQVRDVSTEEMQKVHAEA